MNESEVTTSFHRKTNEECRPREWMYDQEVTKLWKAAAKLGTFGHRNSTMILMGYRHGFRVTELINLEWELINLDEKSLFVKRLKDSKDSQHTLERDEVAALKKLTPERERSGYVFLSERGGPLSRRTFCHVMTEAGIAAGMTFPGSSSHAAPLVRVQSDCGRASNQDDSGLAWTRQYHAHCRIYQARSEPIPRGRRWDVVEEISLINRVLDHIQQLRLELANIDFESLPGKPLNDWETSSDDLPKIPVVYFLVSRSRGLLYIGKATSLSLRWKLFRHITGPILKEFCHAQLGPSIELGDVMLRWWEMPRECITIVESILLQNSMPPWNNHRG